MIFQKLRSSELLEILLYCRAKEMDKKKTKLWIQPWIFQLRQLVARQLNRMYSTRCLSQPTLNFLHLCKNPSLLRFSMGNTSRKSWNSADVRRSFSFRFVFGLNELKDLLESFEISFRDISTKFRVTYLHWVL